MTISLTCPGCRASLEFDDDQANKQGSCPACNAVFTIPGATPPGYGTPQPGPYGVPQAGNVGNPYASSQTAAGYGAGYGGQLMPHRGGTVLTFGILGLVICVIFGIIAWAMGSNDLKLMRAGRMDRTGEGTTQAGMICGMISTILAMVGVAIWLVLITAGIIR